MIWLVIFLLILSGCEQGDKTAVIDEKIEDEEISKVTQWLKVRLNMENVLVINM
jgi:hypothetical protein